MIVDASGLILPNNVINYCYDNMFLDCTSLVQAPSLPATTLAYCCYNSMFRGCTSLTQAPSTLPATKLVIYCYSAMFAGCTSLVQAPSLPATTLQNSCYSSMFEGCSSLRTVTLYYSGSAPTADSYSFSRWLYNAGGTGCTIYAPANALWNSSDSTMDIPSNWTVEKVIYSESDITINNETLSTAISVGNTFNLNASTTPTGATLSYSSSDTSIATVDSNGVITAVAKGTAIITITAQAFQDNTNHIYYNTTSKTVSVECAYPTQQIVITNSTPSEAINPNDTFDLNASTTPTGITLTYSSSDTSVATVNSNGVITGVATGTTTITITAQGFDDDVNKVHYNTTSKTVSVEVQEATPTPAWDDDFLTIEALNAETTIQLKNPSNKNIWYRKDNQTEYTKIPTGYTSITIENANGYIKLYGDNEGVGGSRDNTAFNIYCQMNCNCYGKVTSLLSSGCPETISSTYTFSLLFRQSLIVDASGLILPNNVTANCYYQMFYACTSLTQAPQLPATSLALGCCNGMFWECTSLTQAPQLPATSLAQYCYSSMFWQCTSLTQAPQLPATSLAEGCYSNMFKSCTSLTQAPQLPATSLAKNCYYQMFCACSNLSTVTLYYIDSAPTTGQGYFYKWLQNAGGTGSTIYAPADALWDSSDSEMYIPSTWRLSKTL